MKRARVGIAVRTKDRPIFLQRALRDIAQQTYTDYICVIYNDAGDREAVERVLEGVDSALKERLVVIHNDVSHGMEAASNAAIASVDSEYIAVHDDDDTWHAEFLERAVQHLDATSAAGVVVRTDKIIEEITGDGISEKSRSQWMPDVKAINLYRQCIDNQMTPITFIYKRSIYDRLKGYDESLPVLGDWDFGIRFLQEEDVEYLDPGFALANYHHRKYIKDSTTNNSFGEGVEKHRYWSNRLMNKYLREELRDGRLGVGYMMSKLRYDQHDKAEMIRRILPSFIINKLKKRIQN